MSYLNIAERALANMPIGSVVKIGVTVGFKNSFFQLQGVGVVRRITPGAYCRVLRPELICKEV